MEEENEAEEEDYVTYQTLDKKLHKFHPIDNKEEDYALIPT